MNTSTSEYSGACESGWTMYLDQFSGSEDHCYRGMPVDVNSGRKGAYLDEDDDEEDESMLSDASSGPPHFQQDEDYSEKTRYNPRALDSELKQGKNRKKAKERKSSENNGHHLDDTASSPVQSFPKDKYQGSGGFSQDLSSTQLKGKSVLKKRFGFLKSSHQQKS